MSKPSRVYQLNPHKVWRETRSNRLPEPLETPVKESSALPAPRAKSGKPERVAKQMEFRLS